MAPPAVPNWARVVLIVLSALSFAPQLRLLWTRRDSSGIDLYYVLFNTVVATELFAWSLFVVVNPIEPMAGARDPPDLGDRLNLVQLAVVWLLWVVVLAACVSYPAADDENPRRPVQKVQRLYLAFFFTTVVPVLADAALAAAPGGGGDKWTRKLFAACFSALLTTILTPMVTGLGLAAVYFQARALAARRPGSGSGALSLWGLGAQAVVFGLLAVSWPWRLYFDWAPFGDGDNVPAMIPALVVAWYQVVGFVTIDTVVFAVGQAVLLWLALRRVWMGSNRTTAAETDPLLRRGTGDSYT